MQPVDWTTLLALCTDLDQHWLPARLEQVYQRDRFTICLALRTFAGRHWLTVSWHPQAARLHLGAAPPRSPDTFTFSQQLIHQLGGLALVGVQPLKPWERVVDLQFARRPGDPVLWHLYAEIMGQYSNAILVNANNEIVTAAHQVSAAQSRVRPIQTGDIYELPPSLTNPAPSLEEGFDRWHERLTVIPGNLSKLLIQTYRGLSTALTRGMLAACDISIDAQAEDLDPEAWTRLFSQWQHWIQVQQTGTFEPGPTSTGFSVMGWQTIGPTENLQTLIDRYYTDELNQQIYQQLTSQLTQKVGSALAKLRVKQTGFQTRLGQSDRAEQPRQQADLLMAYLHLWTPGMASIELPDFETGEPVKIPLLSDRNAVHNAQGLYKQHQKLKRARAAVEPLLAEVTQAVDYLDQVIVTLTQLGSYQSAQDLEILEEIREELIQQGYLPTPSYDRAVPPPESRPRQHKTPSGIDILVGRNNRQNDQLTCRTATDYDLWFHTQEIPGSHLLLRLEPGAKAEDPDLQYAADLAAYYSKGRNSDRVPVIYTEPRYVYKPKGAPPGTVIYQHERVIWGNPQQGRHYAEQSLTQAIL